MGISSNLESSTDRQWEDYSLLEMIDVLKLPDEGNINLMNVPDLHIYIAGIKKNYDLYLIHSTIHLVINPISPFTFKSLTLNCLSRIPSITI